MELLIFAAAVPIIAWLSIKSSRMITRVRRYKVKYKRLIKAALLGALINNLMIVAAVLLWINI